MIAVYPNYLHVILRTPSLPDFYRRYLYFLAVYPPLLLYNIPYKMRQCSLFVFSQQSRLNRNGIVIDSNSEILNYVLLSFVAFFILFCKDQNFTSYSAREPRLRSFFHFRY